MWEESYKKGRALNQYPFDSVVSVVFRYISERQNKKALEIGCGSGNNLSFMAREGLNVTGLDISETAVKVARANLKNQNFPGKIYIGSVHNMPFSDESFDFILDRACLTHCPQILQQCLNEVHRVLKKGGIFYSEFFGWDSTDRLFAKSRAGEGFGNFTKGNFMQTETYFLKKELIKNLFFQYEILEVNEVLEHRLNNILQSISMFSSIRIVLKKL